MTYRDLSCIPARYKGVFYAQFMIGTDICVSQLCDIAFGDDRPPNCVEAMESVMAANPGLSLMSFNLPIKGLWQKNYACDIVCVESVLSKFSAALDRKNSDPHLDGHFTRKYDDQINGSDFAELLQFLENKVKEVKTQKLIDQLDDIRDRAERDPDVVASVKRKRKDLQKAFAALKVPS
jgi:hypothetical protein